MREKEGEKCGYFQLVISGKYTTAYWLIIEIKETATLEELHAFIRDIWVECCHHFSAFEIDGEEYELCASIFSEQSSEDTDYVLKDICSVGQTIAYEYDFGSTTELVIKVHSHRIGGWRNENITFLSHNNPYKIICGQCGKNEAQWIDVERYGIGKSFLVRRMHTYRR